jgi:hypothetical protein
MSRNLRARSASGKLVRVRGAGAMWRCHKCGRTFANQNQLHACGRFTMAQHFKGKPPHLRKLFDAFLAIVRTSGPVRVHPVKTRIAFIARMTFASATPMRDRLRAHLILSRRVNSPRFHKIERYTPRCYGHYFHIHSMDELDLELRNLLAEAYHVGMQEEPRSPQS